MTDLRRAAAKPPKNWLIILAFSFMLSLMIGVGNEPQWQRFCEMAGLMDMRDDPRFAAAMTKAFGARELMRNLATRTKPDGGALGGIVEKFECVPGQAEGQRRLAAHQELVEDQALALARDDGAGEVEAAQILLEAAAPRELELGGAGGQLDLVGGPVTVMQAQRPGTGRFDPIHGAVVV